MSIIVQELSKNFRQQPAVQGLSFEVPKGKILGFLGPNGAGKSTTMRMITGYLTPTAGRVTVCGHEVTRFPNKAQRCLGYLLEHNPLYPDMYVKEYLEFMGQMRGLSGQKARKGTTAMIEQCGITSMQDKKIGQLSKGYRQRVGLAQALIHDPEVLILDEPTTGLDPNQLQEIRALIKNASQDKAVMLSTHIMQEVTALCDQVLLIDHGKMVVHDTLDRVVTQTASEQGSLEGLFQRLTVTS